MFCHGFHIKLLAVKAGQQQYVCPLAHVAGTQTCRIILLPCRAVRAMHLLARRLVVQSTLLTALQAHDDLAFGVEAVDKDAQLEQLACERQKTERLAYRNRHRRR